MMKTIVMILLSINFVYSYEAQSCYICESKSCLHPGKDDIKTCSDGTNSGGQATDGASFVNGALKGNGPNNIYKNLAASLSQFANQSANITDSAMPAWEDLTRWVCYVSKDKHRGCMVMAKGHCAGNGNFLSAITSITDKITSIFKKATEAVSAMFTGSTTLTSTQKANVSNWFAENYMANLVNNTNGDQYQLLSCCEGNACNLAFMKETPTFMLIVLFLSTLIII